MFIFVSFCSIFKSESSLINSSSVFSSHERCGIFEIIFYRAVMELDSIETVDSFTTLLTTLAETVESVDNEVKGALCSETYLQRHILTLCRGLYPNSRFHV